MAISKAAQQGIDDALQGQLALTQDQETSIRDALEDRGYAFFKASLSGCLTKTHFFDGEAQMTLASFAQDVLPAVRERVMNSGIASRGSAITMGAKRVRALRQMYPVMLLAERMENTMPVGFITNEAGISLRLPRGYGVNNAGPSIKDFLGTMYDDPTDPRCEAIAGLSPDGISEAWNTMLHWVLDDFGHCIEDAVAPIRNQIRTRLEDRAAVRERKLSAA